jgi:hypothetical protein
LINLVDPWSNKKMKRSNVQDDQDADFVFSQDEEGQEDEEGTATTTGGNNGEAEYSTSIGTDGQTYSFVKTTRPIVRSLFSPFRLFRMTIRVKRVAYEQKTNNR